MKTPNLDKLIMNWSTRGLDDDEANELRVALAEDIRSACEKSWMEGWKAGKLFPVKDNGNHYSRKAVR